MRKPILTLPRFSAAHYGLDKSLKAYKFTKRGKNLSREAFENLLNRSSMSLKATNARARIAVIHTADWLLREYFNQHGEHEKYFWITIAPASTTFWTFAAKRFRPEIMRAQVAKEFEGIDYFGMIDAAYYPRSRERRYKGVRSSFKLGPAVSFHIHLLAWGCSEEAIRGIEDRLNNSCARFIPSRPVFWCDIVSRKVALKRNIYQLKAPLKSYTAWAKMEQAYDTETGEIFWRTESRWEHKKRDLRPGDAAYVHNLLCDYTIPDLMIGGGAGLTLKQRCIKVTKGRLRFAYGAERMLQ